MMEYADARPVARMFAALGEPTRLKITEQLLDGPRRVGELAELIGVPMVNVSHHLGVMRMAGLLEDEKRGRQVYYKFRADVLSDGADGFAATLQIGKFRVHIHRADETKPRARGK
jgi:DNA-binding transcriptional ArsR family regulator